MRSAASRAAVLAVTLATILVVGLTGQDDVRADAQGQVVETDSKAVTCPPFNLFNPDAGYPNVANGLVECEQGKAYRGVRCETESTSAVYFGGRRGMTRANYTTAGFKRCVGCNNGSAYTVDANRGLTRCISGTADAGQVIACQCGQ
jgi:hypothetical protein